MAARSCSAMPSSSPRLALPRKHSIPLRNGCAKTARPQSTMKNIRQNFFFASGVPIAAGLLYPSFGILLSPIVAAAAMALSSVSVIGNALRLRRIRLDVRRSPHSMAARARSRVDGSEPDASISIHSIRPSG